MGKIGMSAIISDSFISWELGDKVILSGGTGTGKSTFALTILSEIVGSTHEKMLILCNRTRLKKQTEASLKKQTKEEFRRFVDIQSYQSLEDNFTDNPEEVKKRLGQYRYIVADECHYFWTDSAQNNYTDIMYDTLLEWDRGTIIYCSATADNFFGWLVDSGKVKKEHVYHIPADYSYVEGVTFYKKNQLRPLIDRILAAEEESKIVVFVSSTPRMREMHEIYGDSASYVCSENSTNWQLKSICDMNCIQNESFEKRILFATSAIDNGINLRDRKIKHIFTELSDIDSIRQSLGRKRSIYDDGIPETDSCRFYILYPRIQDIKKRVAKLADQRAIADQYKNNHDQFVEDHKNDRDFIKKYPMFYPDLTGVGGVKLNRMRHLKTALDLRSYNAILREGFINYVMGYLGEDLAGKVEISNISDIPVSEALIEYLKTLEGKRLYKSDWEDSKTHFLEDMAARHGRSKRCGMKEMNAWLEMTYGEKYPKRFINKDPETGKELRERRRVLDDGTVNPNHDKGYWLLSDAVERK